MDDTLRTLIDVYRVDTEDGDLVWDPSEEDAYVAHISDGRYVEIRNKENTYEMRLFWEGRDGVVFEMPEVEPLWEEVCNQQK